jgi:hypothetical protein
MSNIADRAARVVLMLGNRSDIASRANEWVRDSYIELGMGYDFEELEETHNTSIDGNNEEDTYVYPTVSVSINNWEVRAIKALTLHNNNNNNQVIPLVKKDIRWIDKLPPTTGTPAIFCSYKDSVILRPVPDGDWVLRWRVWLKPRIESGNNMHTTNILLPDDWMEILDWSAALRGHTELLERDKAAEVMQLLFGAEDQRLGRKVPGLIKQRLLRKHAEIPVDDWGMRPRKRSYTR